MPSRSRVFPCAWSAVSYAVNVGGMIRRHARSWKSRVVERPVCFADQVRRRVDFLDCEEHWSAVVAGASKALLVLGMALTLISDNPTTRPNLQTVGLVLSLTALTPLVVVSTIRNPVD